MQSALLFPRLFPPPAAGAEIFAGLDGTGAGSAANADEPFIVQGIVRDIVLANEVSGLLEGPVEKRVKFNEFMGCVPFEVGHVLPVGRLIGANTGDPDSLLMERAPQGFHFSDLAAGFSVFDGVVKGIGAVLGNKFLKVGSVGRKGIDGAPVPFEGARPGGVRFREQTPGIERKQPDGQVVFSDQVGDDLIFQPKTGGKRHLTGKLFRQGTQVLNNTSRVQPGAQGVEPVRHEGHANRKCLVDKKETALRECVLPKGCRATSSHGKIRLKSDVVLQRSLRCAKTTATTHTHKNLSDVFHIGCKLMAV